MDALVGRALSEVCSSFEWALVCGALRLGVGRSGEVRSHDDMEYFIADNDEYTRDTVIKADVCKRQKVVCKRLQL